MTLFRFCWREASKGIRRNRFLSLATVFTSAVALFVLAVFLVGAVNLAHLSHYVEAQVQVAVYLKDGAATSELERLEADLRSVAGVARVSFVSREQALARLREVFGANASLLDGIDEFNPLRDSFEVQVSEARAASAVALAVDGDPLVADVTYGRELVARLMSVTRVLRWGVLGLAGLLALATLFLIQNSIRLSVFARREEIAIMRLVGATAAIIRWPFVIEGMSLGVGGGVVAAAGAAAAYAWAWRLAGRHLAFLPLLSPGPLLASLVPLISVAGLSVGAAGAQLALRRWLR